MNDGIDVVFALEVEVLPEPLSLSSSLSELVSLAFLACDVVLSSFFALVVGVALRVDLVVFGSSVTFGRLSFFTVVYPATSPLKVGSIVL